MRAFLLSRRFCGTQLGHSVKGMGKDSRLGAQREGDAHVTELCNAYRLVKSILADS